MLWTTQGVDTRTAGHLFQIIQALAKFPILTRHKTLTHTSQGDRCNETGVSEIKEWEGYKGNRFRRVVSSTIPPSKELLKGSICFWASG